MMEKTIIKRKHDLYLCQNEKELSVSLYQNGINIDFIVRNHLVEDAVYSILAVGSITKGYGNSESDIDFLVLIENSKDFISHQGNVNIEYGKSFEVLIYQNGIEINFDFMARDKLNDVVDSFLSIAPALYNPSEMKSLNLIGWEDLQFLDRLKNGWVISGVNQVKIWRDEFMVEMLPIYISVKEYFEGNEFLEDAVSALKINDNSASYIARMTVEHGMKSLLGLLGNTDQGKKWIFKWIKDIENKETKELLDRGVILLFPTYPNNTREMDESYVKKVIDYFSEIRTALSKDNAVDKALKFLESKIHYVDQDI